MLRLETREGGDTIMPFKNLKDAMWNRTNLSSAFLGGEMRSYGLKYRGVEFS